MATTRFRDDPARIQKELEQSTFAGRYLLDTPGPGTQLPYMMDPQMRIQKWGANLATDTTNLESELFCLGRKLSHNYDENYIHTNLFKGRQNQYSTNSEHILESRASHPAWMYRDLEQTRWETPFINPITKANLDKPFTESISSRIIAKDTFSPNVPIVHDMRNDV